MKRRLGLFLLTALPFLAYGSSPDHKVRPTRPNILFILCDDLGYGDLGSFGQTHFTTPNLDLLAKQGTRLTHHYSGAPVCAPSRASLLLGLSTGHVPVRDQQFDREIPETNTMASVLKFAGYRTLAIGKWGLGGSIEDHFPADPMKRGFDAWYGLYRHNDGHVHYPDSKHPLFDGYTDITESVKDCYSTDLYTAKAKQWIIHQTREHPQQPFFMYLGYIAPHEAFDIPDSPYPAGGGLTGGVQIPLRTHPEFKNKWIYPEFEKATYRENNNPSSPEHPWTWQMQHYATMVKRIDQGVGDLVQTLWDLKIDKNTLIVFTSDNGPAYDDGLHAPQLISWGILDGFKRDLFEGGLREPTIAWWPKKIRQGFTEVGPSIQYDWLPTFAELAGVVPPVASDGHSLAKSLTRKGIDPKEDFLYFEYFGSTNRLEDKQVASRHGYSPESGSKGDPWGQQQAIRVGKYVGIRAQIKDSSTPLKLYNVESDPHEDHDLSGQSDMKPLIDHMKELMLTARIPQEGNKRPYESAALPNVTNLSIHPGLRWSAYPDPTPWTPDVRYLKKIESGIATTPAGTSYSVPTGNPITLEWTGYLSVPTTGTYNLKVDGGKAAHVWIHESHLLDSEADASHPRRENTIRLSAGWHPIKIIATFDESQLIAGFHLLWSGPSHSDPVEIPSSSFSH